MVSLSKCKINVIIKNQDGRVLPLESAESSEKSGLSAFCEGK